MKHVDPETLAAWSDGGLPSAERLAVESHLADCPQCRAVAAAFGRTLETPAHAAPLAAAAPIAATKWILPFAAAILITTGVAWKYWPREEPPAQMAATQAPAPPAAPPVAPPVSEPVVTSESRAASGQPAKPRAKSERPKTELAPKGVSGGVIDFMPTAPSGTGTRPRPQALPVAAPPPPPAVMAPPPPAMPPPPGVSQAAADARALELMRASRAESVTVTESSWRMIEFWARPGVLANIAGGSGRGGGGSAAGAGITPPVRWRANTPNSIERSLDNGVSWTPIAIAGPAATLTAGNAPNANVCWFVGRAGAVLLSRDGGPFVRLTFPEPLDLISIAAVDHLQATVVAADGRSFVTIDGGQTWRARF